MQLDDGVGGEARKRKKMGRVSSSRRGSVVDLHFTRSTSTADLGGRTSWENSRFSDEILYPAGRGKDRTRTDERDEGPTRIKFDPFCCDGLGRSMQRLQNQIELVKVS